MLLPGSWSVAAVPPVQATRHTPSAWATCSASVCDGAEQKGHAIARPLPANSNRPPRPASMNARWTHDSISCGAPVLRQADSSIELECLAMPELLLTHLLMTVASSISYR